MNKCSVLIKCALGLVILLTYTRCTTQEKVSENHIGTWSLNNYSIVDVPDGFSFHEGEVYDIAALPVRDLDIMSYTLTLLNNNDYSINAVGLEESLGIDETGKWNLSKDELQLDAENGDGINFKVIKKDDNELVVSRTIPFQLISDETYQMTDFVNLNYDDFLALYSTVDVELQYNFMKQTNQYN